MSAASLLLLVGCATASFQVTRPFDAPVQRLSLSFEPLTPTTMTAEQSSRLRTTLTSSLVESGISVVPAGEPEVPAVTGTIELYDPGNRPLRYFVGFGAGRGSFRSVWRVTSSAGAEAGECRVDGSIAAGGFGGSYDEVLEKVGEELRNCLMGAPPP
ncbi:MAG: DUF4410 domain-containing protein [Solirubrobacteraceae bacterium]